MSVITTKRAYSDLESEGLVATVPGKGCFVSEQSSDLLRERRMCHVEQLLGQAAIEALELGVSRAELHDMVDLMAPEGL